MDGMLTELVVFITGLLIGSFINVIIHRLPRNESIIKPGSSCIFCGHRLNTRDLVPVLSYIWLKGRCRYCGAYIPGYYPLVEIITAVSFLLVYINAEISIYTLSGWIFTAFLIAAAVIDINEGIMPDKLTYPAIVLGLALSYFTVGVPAAFMGALLFGGLLFLAAIASRGGMGGGDIKLALAIGAFTGLQGAFLAFIISSLAGGVWALQLLLRKKAALKTTIKFGPFLAVGGWLTFVYGAKIITNYLELL